MEEGEVEGITGVVEGVRTMVFMPDFSLLFLSNSLQFR